MKKTLTCINQPSYTLRQIIFYALKLGTLGFGGPVALVGYMYRDLVERKKWISEEDYKEGLTLAQLAPGPLAAQLAIYLGYVHYHILGATLVGIAFVVPSFLMVLVLGWAYKAYGGLTWMQAVFYGVGAGVIGIIAMSAHKLTVKTLGKDRLLWAIYFISAFYTAVTATESIGLVLAGGLAVWLKEMLPKWKGHRLSAFVPLLGLPVSLAAETTGSEGVLWKIAWFFTKAGAFVFGSGLAIVPFLYGGVVKEYQWLNDRQFLDAVAVAMITPGPVVITVGFIGYLIAGFPGACVAALATFLPCYLFTIIPAPYFKKHGKRPAIVAFINGVTAAAVGAITGAVIVLARRSLVDIPTVLIALAAALILWKVKKIQEPVIILIAAALGVALRLKVGLP